MSLGQPHDVLEAFAVPAPGGVQVEVVGRRGRRGRPGRPPQPRVHRGREAARARRAIRSRCAARPAQAHPRRRRARRRFGRRRRRAARGARAARRRHRRRRGDRASPPRSAPTCRSACRAGRRGCAGGARSWNRSRCRPGSRSWWRSRRSGCRRPTCTRRGTSSAGRARNGSVPAPAPAGVVIPELVNDLEPAAEALEPRMREFRAALEARDRRCPRCSRGAVRRTSCRSPTRGVCPGWSSRWAGGCACPWSGRRASSAACASPS